MTSVYDFNRQLKAGGVGEAALDLFFGEWFDIKPATDAEQRLGIDRHWWSKTDARHWTVEYKTDYVARRTHNAFIETVSVEGKKRGWVYTSTAAWVIYYVVGGDYDLAYLLDLAYIRRVALKKWEQQYPVKSVQNGGGYTTKGLIVPLHELEHHATQISQL